MRCRFSIFVLLSVASIACSKKKEEEKTPEQVRAETLAIPVTPAAALEGVSTALGSVSNVKSPKGNTMNPAVLAVGLAGVDDYCKASGTPKDDIYDSSSGKYAALFAYCNFSKRPDGPDTVLGSVDRVRGWLCAMGDLTYDGTERDLTFSISTACFSQTFVDMVQEELSTLTFKSKVKASNTVDAAFGSTSYATSIVFSIPSLDLTYDILYSQSGSVLAAAIKSGSGESGADGDYFAVYLDRGATATANGYIKVDGRFVRQSRDPIYRHVRAVATGVYDANTKAMTSAANIEFAQMDYFPPESGNSVKIITSKGNPVDGFYSLTKQVSTDPFTSVTGYAASGTEVHCHGEGTCSGNTGINVSAAADLAFIKSMVPTDATYKSSLASFKTTGPLAFTTVVLSE